MYDFLFVKVDGDINLSDLSNCMASYLVTDLNGKILEYGGQIEPLDKILKKDLTNKKVVLIISDLLVSYHVAEIPTKDRKLREQATPYVLEERIVSNVEITNFTLGPEISSNKYLVAVSDKETINGILLKLKTDYNIGTATIITDAICLYERSLPGVGKNSKVYLNKNDNVALIISDNIIVTDLNNLELIFKQYIDKVSIDLYKFKSDNIYSYFSEGNEEANKKLTVNTEQEIIDWLPFLVQSWFKNKRGNHIDLAFGLVAKPSRLDSLQIKFNKFWRSIAAVWVVILFGFTVYKYFDNAVYTNRKLILDQAVKQQLSSVSIKALNLDEAKSLIERKISNVTDEIIKFDSKNKFYIILSGFAKLSDKFIANIIINEIKFNNDILEINFAVKQNDEALIQNAKINLADNKIKLQEKFINNNITWILSA